jgi:hypothetical protein
MTTKQAKYSFRLLQDNEYCSSAYRKLFPSDCQLSEPKCRVNWKICQVTTRHRRCHSVFTSIGFDLAIKSSHVRDLPAQKEKTIIRC